MTSPVNYPNYTSIYRPGSPFRPYATRQYSIIELNNAALAYTNDEVVKEAIFEKLNNASFMDDVELNVSNWVLDPHSQWKIEDKVLDNTVLLFFRQNIQHF